MKLQRIAQAVMCEPWMITPARHAVLQSIVEAHISGAAHLPDGCASLFEEADNGSSVEYEVINGSAVIPLAGVVGMRVGALAKSSGVADLLDTQTMIELALADESVRSIVLSIDSPGGTVTGTPETAALVASARHRKPIVAFTDTEMASAAYYIGSQADVVIASQSALVGSIGVYMAILDQSIAYAREGLSVELFKAGKHKGLGTPGTSLSDEQRSMLQREVDAMYADFRAAVLSARMISDEDMQGQWFRGADAIARGLVDEIGNMAVALERAAELVNARE